MSGGRGGGNLSHVAVNVRLSEPESGSRRSLRGQIVVPTFAVVDYRSQGLYSSYSEDAHGFFRA